MLLLNMVRRCDSPRTAEVPPHKFQITDVLVPVTVSLCFTKAPFEAQDNLGTKKALLLHGRI